MRTLVERYLDFRRPGIRDRAMANMSSALERLARDWDRTRRKASGLDEQWLSEWLAAARMGRAGGNGKLLKDSSYNKLVCMIRHFVEYAVRRAEVHPFTLDACVAVPEGPRKDYLRLSAAQVVQMIETCEDPWERWVLALASQTLGRESELLNRQVRHLHFDRAQPVIDWYRRKTVDKDELFATADLVREWQRWTYAYQTQCGSLERGWRLIPRREYRGVHGWVYHPQLPPTRLSGIVQRHAARVSGEVREDLKGQGVHILRRSMARALYDRLVELEVYQPDKKVQTALGHAKVETTMLYIGVDPDRASRNELLAGSNLLWAPRENVVTIRSVGHG